MSKVTVVSRPNRITIASKGVQGAPGDITPEALAARDAAQEARDEAQAAATTATGAASAAALSADAAAASAASIGDAVTDAEQAATAAEQARDAAQLSAGVYATTAAGLAATTNGAYFNVPASGADDSLILYRNNAGAAVEVKRYPSSARVAALDSRLSAVEVDVAATGMSYPTPSAINLDLAAGLLRITASQVRVFYGRKSFLLAGQDVALPTARRRIIADTSTGTVSFSSATTTPAGSVVLGSYDHQAKELIGFPPHFVNGVLKQQPTFGRAAVTVASGITFDLTARELVMNSVRIITPYSADSYSVTVPFPANQTVVYRLELQRGAANPISFVTSSATPDPNKIIWGFVRVQADRVDVYGIDQYVVTGGPPPAEVPLSIYEGTLIGTLSPQYINFDWIGGYLRITGSGQVRCLYGRNVQVVPDQNMEIPASPIVWHKVLYDTETGLLSALPANNMFQPAKSIVVGLVKRNTREVFGFPSYYVNGQPSAAGGSNLESVEWLPVDGPTEPRFTVPALLPDFKVFGGSATNTDYNSIYSLYDALVSTYPDYVSRTLLGNDDAANPIYRYDFKPPADNGTGDPGRLAKMILASGAHGYERAGIYCLYSALHQIASRWDEDDLLDTLRWNCHFIVVPCLVPYGFNTVTRLNPNGVDIARNFTAEWSSSQANSGSGPLSEKESQYLDAVMAANRDAIYCGSFHNFLDTSSGDTNFIWNASASMFGIRLAQRLVAKMSRKWKAEYPWLVQNNTTLFGYSNLSAPPGSEGKQSTLAYGIQGGSFEISRRLWDAPDDTSYSQFVNTLGTETIVNWLLMNLEHGTQLYNGRGS